MDLSDLIGMKNVVADLLPTKKSERNWGIYSYFATWIGMDIGIPTYYLASSLMVGGMDLKWAMFTILLANVLIAFPILANGHAGAKYGIPSTIYWRSAFGFNGASVAAILRGVVAAGWCGIQFWIGGSAINTVLGILFPAWAARPVISIPMFACPAPTVTISSMGPQPSTAREYLDLTALKSAPLLPFNPVSSWTVNRISMGRWSSPRSVIT